MFLSLVQNTSSADVYFTMGQMGVVLGTMLAFNLLPASVAAVLWARDERRRIARVGATVHELVRPGVVSEEDRRRAA